MYSKSQSTQAQPTAAPTPASAPSQAPMPAQLPTQIQMPAPQLQMPNQLLNTTNKASSVPLWGGAGYGGPAMGGLPGPFGQPAMGLQGLQASLPYFSASQNSMPTGPPQPSGHPGAYGQSAAQALAGPFAGPPLGLPPSHGLVPASFGSPSSLPPRQLSQQGPSATPQASVPPAAFFASSAPPPTAVLPPTAPIGSTAKVSASMAGEFGPGEWRAWAVAPHRLCPPPAFAHKDRDDDPAGNDTIPAFALVLADKFEALKAQAQPEDWGGADLKILRVFCDNTFRRASEQSPQRRTVTAFFPSKSRLEPTVVLTHSGLMTPDTWEVIYMLFQRNKRTAEDRTSLANPEGPRWFLSAFVTEPTLVNPNKMGKFSAPHLPRDLFPQRVTYWDKHIGELCFDPTVPVLTSIDFVHLEEKQRMHSRVPYPYAAQPAAELMARIKDGTAKALVRVEASPRMAVAQYFRDKHGGGKGEVQMLLPIRLDFSYEIERPHCVLALRRIVTDYQKDYYLPVTLLSLEMAYLHARLLHPIDQTWLLNCRGKGGGLRVSPGKVPKVPASLLPPAFDRKDTESDTDTKQPRQTNKERERTSEVKPVEREKAHAERPPAMPADKASRDRSTERQRPIEHRHASRQTEEFFGPLHSAQPSPPNVPAQVDWIAQPDAQQAPAHDSAPTASDGEVWEQWPAEDTDDATLAAMLAQEEIADMSDLLQPQDWEKIFSNLPAQPTAPAPSVQPPTLAGSVSGPPRAPPTTAGLTGTKVSPQPPSKPAVNKAQPPPSTGAHLPAPSSIKSPRLRISAPASISPGTPVPEVPLLAPPPGPPVIRTSHASSVATAPSKSSLADSEGYDDPFVLTLAHEPHELKAEYDYNHRQTPHHRSPSFHSTSQYHQQPAPSTAPTKASPSAAQNPSPAQFPASSQPSGYQTSLQGNSPYTSSPYGSLASDTLEASHKYADWYDDVDNNDSTDNSQYAHRNARSGAGGGGGGGGSNAGVEFTSEDFDALKQILESAFFKKGPGGNSSPVVELAQLAPYLQARLPKLKTTKRACKRLIEAAERAHIVTLDQKGKQYYVALIPPDVQEQSQANPGPAAYQPTQRLPPIAKSISSVPAPSSNPTNSRSDRKHK